MALLSGLPGIPSFDAVGDVTSLAQRWLKWKERFHLYVAASGVTDDTQKRALLLHCAGPGVLEIFNGIPEATRGSAKEFDKAVKALDDFFKETKNVLKERQNFWNIKPEPGETLNNLITRLRTAAEHCEFGDEKGNQIRDKALLEVTNKKLKTKLSSDGKMTLDTMLTTIATYEYPDAIILRPKEDDSSAQGSKSQGASKSDQAQAVSSRPFRGRGRGAAGTGFRGCYRCGERGHFARECAISEDHVCEKCGNKGHTAARCHTKSVRGNSTSRGGSSRGTSSRGKRGNSQASRGRGGKSKQSVHSIHDEPAGDTPDNGIYYAWSTFDGSDKTDGMVMFKIDNCDVEMLVDSGSTCDIIPESVLKLLNKDLSPVDRQVFAYNSEKPLDTMGIVNAKIAVPGTDKSVTTKLIVVKGSPTALLGRHTAMKLGVLRIGVDIVNACDEATSTKPVSIKDLQECYPNVFSGLGKLKDCQLKLHVDDSVVPVAQPIRRIPFSRRAKVNEKLEELLKLDVIEKVEGPSTWVNPLVAVEKPNGDVRVCLDMRQANRAILRQRHPIPTVEETIKEMSGGIYFSKLDLNMGYHQIELEPESRDITTFSGPSGLYRYKRLLFGINMASEKFQSLISQVIAGCDGAYNISDDIVVVGASRAEHDARLKAVIQRLQDRGLTLNGAKCAIGVKSINYMGHVLTDGGVKVSDEKVKAITNAPRPTTRQEVRSFLGSVQFCAKFIKDFGTVSEPLWELTKSQSEWKWGKSEESAFREIKERLIRAPVMAYFKSGAETRIITDASPVGLGAVLEQKQADGLFRPIYYASRKLSDVETRYSQFEREALAVRWACQKFHLFVYGIDFEILTDHKPLVAIFNGKHKAPNARLERWLLSLQPYTFTVSHIPGKSNTADGLSRLPIDGSDAIGEHTEDFAFSVIAEAIPGAIKLQQIEQSSENDQNLKLIRNAVTSGDWGPLSGSMYHTVRNELWVQGNIVMRNDRIVIPEVLRKQVLTLAHEGHQGMTRTKARLRLKVWWPTMNSEVEEFIRACHPCQLVGSRPRPEPIRSTPLPPGPWTDLAIDLCGPLPNGDMLFVIVDYYSRWPEVIWLKNTSASTIIKCLENVFQTHGLPETIRSDNGPQFVAQEFSAFCDYLDIQHKKGVPYWPQSNGEVERVNETLLKIVKIANVQKQDLRKEMGNFLFQYRNTPHATTGLSPAELLMGRKLRDKLPCLSMSLEKPTESEWQRLARERDSRKKAQYKAYADERRCAVSCDIVPGDKVLMPKKRDNKLSCNFEEEPCVVLEREGNAVIVQTADGTKMRNTAHLKKFVEKPVAAAEPLTPSRDEPAGMTLFSPSSPGKPSGNSPSGNSQEVEKGQDASVTIRRSSRTSAQPTWLKDFVT